MKSDKWRKHLPIKWMSLYGHIETHCRIHVNNHRLKFQSSCLSSRFSNLFQSIFISMPEMHMSISHQNHETPEHHIGDLHWSAGNSSCILSVNSTSLVQRWPVSRKTEKRLLRVQFIWWPISWQLAFLIVPPTWKEKSFSLMARIFFTCNFQVLHNFLGEHVRRTFFYVVR